MFARCRCAIDSGECNGCIGATCGFGCEQQCSPWLGCRTCDQNCQGCTSCNAGLWGLGKDGCKNFCGNCVGFVCDESDGTCAGSGCLSGWSGAKCDQPCTEACSAGQVCTGGECKCPPGLEGAGCLVKQALGISCEKCNELVGAAKLAVEVAKKYASFADAEKALQVRLMEWALEPTHDLPTKPRARGPLSSSACAVLTYQ